MSGRGCLPVAVVLVAGVGVAALAGASPWDDVAHPNRRRCTQLLADAERFAEARQWTVATQAARTAATLCPSDRGVLQKGGEILIAAGEFPEARRQLERARSLADASPTTRERELTLAYLVGVARQRTGELDGAIDEHRRLEAMGGLPPPNKHLVHQKLGEELMAAGRLGEAIAGYRRALALAPPTRPIVRLALAVALDRDEQTDQARTELAAVLALDPGLRCLADDAQLVPAEDVHYYRALALNERGATAEARLALRRFVAELPSSPYAAHARQRLADAERHVDARELEATAAGIDRAAVAQALGPVAGLLESCLPMQLVRIRLQLGGGRIVTDRDQPAADCLDRVLSRVDASSIRAPGSTWIVVPLAGRRGAASLP